MTQLTKPRKPLNAYTLFLKLSTKKYRMTGDLTFPSEEVIQQVLSDYENKVCTWANRPRATTPSAASFREMSRKANIEWKQLGAEKRRLFIQSANRAREEYEESMREWRLSQDHAVSSGIRISYSTVSPPPLGDVHDRFSVHGFNLVDIHEALIPTTSFSRDVTFLPQMPFPSLYQSETDCLATSFEAVRLDDHISHIATPVNATEGLIDPSQLDSLF